MKYFWSLAVLRAADLSMGLGVACSFQSRKSKTRASLPTEILPKPNKITLHHFPLGKPRRKKGNRESMLEALVGKGKGYH